MAPSTQKALLVTEIGKPLKLVTDHRVPQPGKDQVLIEVTVAGPNPHDHKARDTGLFIAQNLPAVLTNDVVGKVVELGEGVTKYAVGDRIVAQGDFDGGYAGTGFQEYAVEHVNASMKIPDSISDDAAANLPTNLIASVVGLYDPTGLGIPAPWTNSSDFDAKDTTILILGGGSGCGKFAVQLAKLAGIGRIVVVGGDEKELKSYGATDIIDRHGSPDEVTKRIRDIVGDDLLYAFDAINDVSAQPIGINALSNTKRGKFARLIPRPLGDAEKLIKPKKDGYELKSVFGSSHARPETCKPLWENLGQWLVDGKIKPTPYVVERGLDADKVNAVLDKYRDGERVTKTHFHIRE
jgi:NADPH:quinone reductase